MPKMKTHSGAKKRFRVTGKGKLRREMAGKRHYMVDKSNRRARRLDGTNKVADADAPRAKKMLGR